MFIILGRTNTLDCVNNLDDFHIFVRLSKLIRFLELFFRMFALNLGKSSRLTAFRTLKKSDFLLLGFNFEN